MKKIQISIPEPCHEDWNKMSKAEKGKYCNSCCMTVVDFSQMSDRQLAEFFKRPAGSLCGRFNVNQLERDILVPKKRIPWVRYFFQFLIPAFLVSLRATAQGKVMVDREIHNLKETCNTVNSKDSVMVKKNLPALQPTNISQQLQGMVGMVQQSKTITGTISDENGDPLAFASVVIKGTTTGVLSDEKGKFSIQAYPSSVLVISCIGFRSYEIKISGNEIDISLTLSQELSGVVIVGYIHPRKKPIVRKVIDTILKKKEIETGTITIYPNPIRPSSAFSIELKKLVKGEYRMEIINNSGVLVSARDFIVEDKKQLLDNVSPATSGIYYLNITNRKTSKKFTQKIIVE